MPLWKRKQGAVSTVVAVSHLSRADRERGMDMLQAAEEVFVTISAPSRLGSALLSACLASIGVEEGDRSWGVFAGAALLGYACRRGDPSRAAPEDVYAEVRAELIVDHDGRLDYAALAEDPDRFRGILELIASAADDVGSVAELANCATGGWEAFSATATYQLHKNLRDNGVSKRMLPSPETVEHLLRIGYAIGLVDEVAGEMPTPKTGMTPLVTPPRRPPTSGVGATDAHSGAASRERVRAPVGEWPEQQIVEQIRACYVGDEERPHVRAAVVFHQDPALLQEDAVDDARRQAEEDGVPFEGLSEWVVFRLDFDDDDRVGLYMEHDVTCLVRAWDSAFSEAEAREKAQAWIAEAGDEPQHLEFRWLPGVYQAATIAFIKGTRPIADKFWFGWVMPGTNGYHPMRHYPPKLPEGREEGEPEVDWVLLPEHAVQALYADRGW
jgi:hypothetical protein